MSDQPKVYPNRKRLRDDKNERRLKQQKPTEAVAKSSSIQTKITDVNDDCLEKVFLYLSFDDLLNIARTNTKLIPAAELVFASKFGKETVYTSHFDGSEPICPRVAIIKNAINLNGLRYSLRVLRCFGHMISKLIICHDYKHHYHHCDKIILYASRYGFDSLTEIEFKYVSRDIFMHFEKPFLKAETVRFFNCSLKERSATLNTWFPKMRSLKLHHVVAAPKHIEIHLPHLQRLEIKGAIPTQKTENTLGILRLNSQLRTLILDTNYTTRFIRCAHQNLQLLEHLEIRCNYKDFNDFDGDVIEFKRLKHLKINSDGCLYSKIPFLAEQLEEFTCNFNYFARDKINNLIDFFVKHPSIIKLKLNMNGSWFVRDELDIDSSKIAEALPLLQEVEFDDIDLSAEEVIPFTNNCDSLKIFRFDMDDQLEFNRLTEQLDEQWESLKNGYTVTLNRKI